MRQHEVVEFYVYPKPPSPTQKLRHENKGGKFSGLIPREDIVDGPRTRAPEISDIREQIDTAVRRYGSPSDSKESMLLHIIKAVKSKDILPGEAGYDKEPYALGTENVLSTQNGKRERITSGQITDCNILYSIVSLSQLIPL